MVTEEKNATGSEVGFLDVRNLKKHFPIQKGFLKRTVGAVRAVDDVSFAVNEGETLGLVGESGCGKTTTARCILRAIDPTSGEILFKTKDGEVVNVTDLPRGPLRELRADMQMIFQDPFGSLNPRMTLLDIVGEPLLVHGMDNRKDRADRVAELLRLVGLRPEYMRRFPHAFSGGERQRIGIARALYREAKIILFDEATNQLDTDTESSVMQSINNLNKEITIIFIAHRLSTLKNCDQIIDLAKL